MVPSTPARQADIQFASPLGMDDFWKRRSGQMLSEKINLEESLQREDTMPKEQRTFTKEFKLETVQ